jgi:HD-like signal output (HDOD) protein
MREVPTISDHDHQAEAQVSVKPRPDERKRILFVDDEVSLLDGLRDALRSHRSRWSMTFVPSGEEALAAIERQPFDIVVSDLRMPGMDGAALLEKVRERWPTTVRIVLSGYAEPATVARASSVAHQLLSKPCEIDQLVAHIDRADQLTDTIARVEMRRAAVGTTILPSPPRVHVELAEALESDDASIQDISAFVERDMALAAKILQLANSAYFGRSHPVSAISDAVSYLGLETVHALVLQADAFRQLPAAGPGGGLLDVDELQRHCWRVANLARRLVDEPSLQRTVFTAGLLHDVGLLVLATQERSTLDRILVTAREERRPLFSVEQELCGVTHAEIGAHLLALWGLPFTITSAIAAQGSPPTGPLLLDEAGATYLANALIEELESDGSPGPANDPLDVDHLQSCGLGDQLPGWRALAARG